MGARKGTKGEGWDENGSMVVEQAAGVLSRRRRRRRNLGSERHAGRWHVGHAVSCFAGWGWWVGEWWRRTVLFACSRIRETRGYASACQKCQARPITVAAFLPAARPQGPLGPLPSATAVAPETRPCPALPCTWTLHAGR
jgi:hypothetical protein